MSLVQSCVKDDVLTIFVSGRIDSSNAYDVAGEIEAARTENPHSSVLLDTEELTYISSAGLRCVLALRKAEPSLRIVNASQEVYNTFDMTGFTEMIPIEKALRRFSVDGCTVIGQGAKGTVYRYNDDTIIKVYKNPDSLPDIKNERELARRAFVLGVPTAISYDIVKVGDSYGSVFELLDAQSYSELIVEQPENRERYIAEYAALLRQIHSTEVNPGDMPDIKIFVRDWIRVCAPFLPEETTKKVSALVDAVPDVVTMLHCDYHTNNVLSQNGEALLIDMDTLSHGHPIFELANVYITYVGFGEVDPTFVEKFIGMPYDLSVSVFRSFLPKYLGTEDEAVIADVERKIKLLSYVRYMRHTVRRGDEATETGKKVVDLCRENIIRLAEELDTLTF